MAAGKSIQPLLDIAIEREIRSVELSHDEYIAEYRKSGIYAQHVHCFVVLSDGRTVGLNENPSRGWTYPIGRYVELELRLEPVDGSVRNVILVNGKPVAAVFDQNVEGLKHLKAMYSHMAIEPGNWRKRMRSYIKANPNWLTSAESERKA